MDDCYTLQVEATFRSVSEVRCSILSSYFRETKMYRACEQALCLGKGWKKHERGKEKGESLSTG